jgi:hypothetical protein
MQAQSRMKLWRAGQVNSFLLCTVLAKQTRRLGRLMPDSRIPELITIALKNCADYELALDVDAGVPEVVREEAMQIGRLTRRPEPVVVSSPERFERSEIADAVSASGGQGATEGVAAAEVSLFGEGAIGAHLPVGSRVDSPDFRRNLHSVQNSVQRKHSMTNSNGVDPIHLRQLRAMAENLCTQANHHRENHNYLVAYGLYGRALSVAQEIHTPENDGNVLVTRIRADQQAVFQMLHSGESGLEKPPSEKAQRVGR